MTPALSLLLITWSASKGPSDLVSGCTQHF